MHVDVYVFCVLKEKKFHFIGSLSETFMESSPLVALDVEFGGVVDPLSNTLKCSLR